MNREITAANDASIQIEQPPSVEHGRKFDAATNVVEGVNKLREFRRENADLFAHERMRHVEGFLSKLERQLQRGENFLRKHADKIIGALDAIELFVMQSKLDPIKKMAIKKGIDALQVLIPRGETRSKVARVFDLKRGQYVPA